MSRIIFGEYRLIREESEGKNKYFEKALSSFTYDFANGGIIKHLTDEGYSPSEILERLTHPTNLDRVKEEMEAYLFETGRLKEQIGDDYILLDLTGFSAGALKKSLEDRLTKDKVAVFVDLNKTKLKGTKTKGFTDRELEYVNELPCAFFVPSKRALEILSFLAIKLNGIVKFYVKE